MKMTKFWKKNTAFQLTTLKLAYTSIFFENLGKTFSVILTDPGKNEDKDEKIQKTSTIFELTTLKLDGLQNVIKIWGKMFCF